MKNCRKNNQRKTIVCLVCLKRFSCDENKLSNKTITKTNHQNGLYEEDNQTESERNAEDPPPQKKKQNDKTSDIYRRFLVFSSRYFGLHVITARFRETAEQRECETGEVLQAFCEDCLVLVQSICELHEELQLAQMKLSWKLELLGDLMGKANQSVSTKLAYGLVRDVTRNLNIPVIGQCDIYRKVIIAKCRAVKKLSQPKAIVPKGLFPEYYRFTYAATRKALMGLIMIFGLASSFSVTRTPALPVSKIKKTGKPILRGKRRLSPTSRGRLKKKTAGSLTLQTASCVELSLDVMKNSSAVNKLEANEEVKSNSENSDWNELRNFSGPADEFGNDFDLNWSDADTGDGQDADPSSGKTFNSVLKVVMKDGGVSRVRRSNRRRTLNKKLNLGESTSGSGSSESESEKTENEPDSDFQVDSSLTINAPEDKTKVKQAVPAGKRKVGKSRKLSFEKFQKGKILDGEDSSVGAVQCEICHERFKSVLYLVRHLRRKHEKTGEKTIQCFHCNLSFVHKLTYELHMQNKVYHDCNFVCDEQKCLAEFETHLELNEHLKVHVNGEIVNEDEGEGVKNGKEEVKTIHYCPVCHWGFLNPSFLQVHQITHTAPRTARNYLCPVPGCEAICKNVGPLMSHWNKVHGQNIKPYKCTLCGVSFHTRQQLRSHLYISHDLDAVERRKFWWKIHRNKKESSQPQKIYTCLICNNQKFNTKHKFSQHNKRVHGGPFICPEEGCGKEFPRLGRYRYHCQTSHGHATQHMCQICGKLFAENFRLKYHIEGVHGEPKFECKICHKMFKSNLSLKNHMEQHNPDRLTFICPHCGKSFKCPSGLDYHIGSVHTANENKRHGCPYCPKRFNRPMLLKGHMRTCSKINGGKFPQEIQVFNAC